MGAHAKQFCNVTTKRLDGPFASTSTERCVYNTTLVKSKQCDFQSHAAALVARVSVLVRVWSVSPLRTLE
jgi:hypothetical protein